MKQLAIAAYVIFAVSVLSSVFTAVVGATFTRGQIMIGYAVIGAVALVVWGILAMRERARAKRKRADAVKAGLASLRDPGAGPAG